MNYKFASLIVASLALSAGSQGVVSAQRVRVEAVEVEVVVNGVPQRRYAHDGRWYVEALKGQEYAIRMRNPYPVRVAVALSVDGLNTIDARHTAAADGRKWVIEPFQTITISGWQVNRAEARRFEFTTEARSYGQALGVTANLGVISAVFFKERAPVMMTRESHERSEESGRLARTAPEAPAAAEAQAAGSSTAADATNETVRRRGVRRHRDGPANRPCGDAGVSGPGDVARADREHPLRVPSATCEAWNSAGRAGCGSAAAPRAFAGIRGRLQPGSAASLESTYLTATTQRRRRSILGSEIMTLRRRVVAVKASNHHSGRCTSSMRTPSGASANARRTVTPFGNDRGRGSVVIFTFRVLSSATAASTSSGRNPM